MFSIIIRELGQRQPLYPVILLKVRVHSQIRFKRLILALRLAIHLRMVGSTEAPRYAKCLTELRPITTGKQGPSVSNNRGWCSSFIDNFCQEHISKFFGIIVRGGRKISRRFSVSINHN
jgi:hypothetical protein